MPNLLKIITQEMTLRNYSSKTIKAYTYVFKDLYKHFQKPLRNLSEEEIKQYLYQKQRKGLSSQTMALFTNAINFLFLQVLSAG